MVFVLLHPHSVVVGDFLPGVVLVGPQLTLIILVEEVVLILLSSIQPVPGIVNLQLYRIYFTNNISRDFKENI